jgi:hypothetical protein
MGLVWVFSRSTWPGPPGKPRTDSTLSSLSRFLFPDGWVGFERSDNGQIGFGIVDLMVTGQFGFTRRSPTLLGRTYPTRGSLQ